MPCMARTGAVLGRSSSIGGLPMSVHMGQSSGESVSQGGPFHQTSCSIEKCRNTVITTNTVIVGSPARRKGKKRKEVELAMEICSLTMSAHEIHIRTKYSH